MLRFLSTVIGFNCSSQLEQARLCGDQSEIKPTGSRVSALVTDVKRAKSFPRLHRLHGYMRMLIG